MAPSATRSAAILTLAALALATPAAWAGKRSTSQRASSDSQVATGKQGATTAANRMGAHSAKLPRRQAPQWVEENSFSFGAARVDPASPGPGQTGPGKVGSIKQIQVSPPGSTASAQLPRRRMFVPPPK